MEKKIFSAPLLRTELFSLLFLFTMASGIVQAAPPFDAIWVNDGQMPIFEEDRPASHPDEIPPVNGQRYIGAGDVISYIWDGTTIHLKGAKNEVVEFDLVLEGNDNADIDNVTVVFDKLTGPNGFEIKSRQVSSNGIFDYVGRQIELFLIESVQWEGAGMVTEGQYLDPGQTNHKYANQGLVQFRYDFATQTRPNWHKHVPDIAIPMEIVNPNNNHSFTVTRQTHREVWADIYIPHNAPAGRYTGTVEVRVNGQHNETLPVELMVRNMTLPDEMAGDWALFSLGYMVTRMAPDGYSMTDDEKLAILNNVQKLMHRHRVQAPLMDGYLYTKCNVGWSEMVYTETDKTPCLDPTIQSTRDGWHEIMDTWFKPYLDGSMFTAENGYEGPGENTGTNIMPLYPYFDPALYFRESEIDHHGLDNIGDMTNVVEEFLPMTKRFLLDWVPYWNDWFRQNAPQVEFFYYLIDENDVTLPWDNDLAMKIDQINTASPEAPHKMKVFKSVPISYNTYENGVFITHQPVAEYPYIDMWYVCSGQGCEVAHKWPESYALLHDGTFPDHGGFPTNGDLPGQATFEIEGSYVRAWDWINEKLQPQDPKVFNFAANLWANDAFGWGDQIILNFWENMHTHGMASGSWNNVRGEAGYEYRNTSGLLLYPGKDYKFPQHNYGIDGVFASVRLKKWRRSIQDVLYIRMAKQVGDAAQIDQIIRGPAPRGYWETPTANPNYGGDWYDNNLLGFETDGNLYANALDQLAQIIMGSGSQVGQFAQEFGLTACAAPGTCNYDMDGDGDVDGRDLALFLNAT